MTSTDENETATGAPGAPPVPPRTALGAARRVVVKVGSSSLTSLAGGLDPARLDAIVDALAARRAAGSQVVLVSSGAIAAGLAPLRLARRPRDLATQQAAAAVGQLALAQAYGESFGRHGQLIGQVLLTADDMIRRAHYRNAQRTLERLLGLDVLPVVNENDTVATDEIRVGDNDRLAALVAHLVGADALVLLSDVDGLYDGDPRRPGSRLLPEVEAPTDLETVRIASPGAGSLGTGGMATKITAAAMASAAGIPVLLAAAEQVGAALAVGSGGPTVGTAFRPSGRRMSARRFWLRHAADVRGRLQLDDGAVAAVVGRRRSLLAAGIHAISGDFDAGDVVDLVAPDGTVVARGVAGFDAGELPALIGRRTRDLAPEQRREVVHADDLVPF
ncbi:glutamate 5-kinase [Pseudonocardia humida]|uniref:Glutamate 5-kinase n=1 Tax=Pseudonocardia humida TaxID=2800819 RepID=A0ABT1A0Q4_9PSEU|nr:glutamate 5-kinase [Pseudonocardia humida]MCO1656580.1 glutamate 5-kinase [Pseudonocardia humida]